MSSLCVKFQPSSILVLIDFGVGVVVLVVVTGIKQSQLLVLRLRLVFDNKPLISTCHSLLSPRKTVEEFIFTMLISMLGCICLKNLK